MIRKRFTFNLKTDFTLNCAATPLNCETEDTLNCEVTPSNCGTEVILNCETGRTFNCGTETH